MFAPRPLCTYVTGRGLPCKKNACTGADHGLCALHHHMSHRTPDWTYHTGPPCIAKTVRGEQCKCSPHPGLDVCLRHSRKKAPTLDIPTECAICMNVMVSRERSRLKLCGHYFHTACLTEWATHRGKKYGDKLKASCPMCFKPRKLVTLPELKIWIPRQHPIFPYIIRVNFDNPEIRIHRWVDAPYNYNAVFWVFKNADYVYKTSEFEWSI